MHEPAEPKKDANGMRATTTKKTRRHERLLHKVSALFQLIFTVNDQERRKRKLEKMG